MSNVMSITDGMETLSRFNVADAAFMLLFNCKCPGNTKKVKAKKRTETAVSEFSDLPLFANFVTVDTTAATELVGVSKKLMESKELTAIQSADSVMRKWLYTKGFTSDIDGILWIPKGVRTQVQRGLEQFLIRRDGLIDQFMSEYSATIATARGRLGDLFDPKNYPSESAIRSKFSVRFRFVSFSVPDELRVVSPETYAEEVRKAQEQAQQTANDIMDAMRESFLKLVSNLTDALAPSADGKHKRFHGSNLQKLQEYLSDFSDRNICKDDRLANLASQASALLSGVTAEGIKSNDEFKARLVERMDSLGSQLRELVTDAPTRRMRNRYAGDAPETNAGATSAA